MEIFWNCTLKDSVNTLIFIFYQVSLFASTCMSVVTMIYPSKLESRKKLFAVKKDFIICFNHPLGNQSAQLSGCRTFCKPSERFMPCTLVGFRVEAQAINDAILWIH